MAAAKPLSRRKKLLFAVVALIAALLVATLLLEGLTRLVAPQDLSGSWRVPSPVNGMAINKAGGRARHQLGDRVVTYRFNEDHLRGGPVPASGLRVLCVGDSFTFGWLLAEEDTFVRRLEALAAARFGPDRVHFLNGGAGGWGTAHYVSFVENHAAPISPDAVLVFVNSDDIGRSLRRPVYDLSAGELTQRRVPVSRLKQFMGSLPGYEWLLEHSHLLQLLRHSALGFLGSEPAQANFPGESLDSEAADWSHAVALGKAVFRRLHAWCSARDIPLYVATTGFHDMEQTAGVWAPTRAFLQESAAFFGGLGVPYHDNARHLVPPGKTLADLQIPGDGHPTEQGARLIAERTWPWLEPHLVRLLEDREEKP